MSRPPRILVAGGVYHVVARGNARQMIFLDDVDRAWWLEILEIEAALLEVEVIAYCQMGNHFHLLVCTPRANLPRFMRRLNGGYAQRSNRRHRRDGHLYQGRYGARLVQQDAHLLAHLRYIVRNPVTGGLCDHPRDWRWSSHRATLGLEPVRFLKIDRLYAQLGHTRVEARRAYAELTESEERSTLPGDHPLVDGTPEFAKSALETIQPHPEHARAMLTPTPRTLDSLLGTRAHTDVAALATAVREGYSLSAIATHLGVHTSTISRRLRRAGDIP